MFVAGGGEDIKISSSLFLGKGVFFLDGIFSFKSIGKINYQSGIMMGEAMKYAVLSVNNNSQLLFGYTFEIKEIYGSNDEDDVRDNVLQTFLARIPFLIGPYSSETLYVASILTRHSDRLLSVTVLCSAILILEQCCELFHQTFTECKHYLIW